jgi:Xaa-Pro aminopeptidase
VKRFFENRLIRLRDAIETSDLFFTCDDSDIFYLTGFTGDSSSLLISKEDAFFITDGRYIEQIKLESQVSLQVLDVKDFQEKTVGAVKSVILDASKKRFLFCKRDIKLAFYESLSPFFDEQGIEVSDFDKLKFLRMRKDALEIEIIRANLILTELGFHYIIRMLKPGMRESEVALELEYYLRKQGAQKPAFDTIVAANERSALPHATASESLIPDNAVVLFDFGVKKDMYCSDFTRCFAAGNIPPEIKEIHPVVKDALFEARKVAKPGVTAKDIHNRALNVISEAGFGDKFIHSTGHGVGIDIHEAPWIHISSDTVLEEGMVFTIEPGIYLPGIGGVRLEDMVVITEGGCEVLTSCGYDL